TRQLEQRANHNGHPNRSQTRRPYSCAHHAMACLCCADEIGCQRCRRVSEELAASQERGSRAVWTAREAGDLPNDNIASLRCPSTQLKGPGVAGGVPANEWL